MVEMMLFQHVLCDAYIETARAPNISIQTIQICICTLNEKLLISFVPMGASESQKILVIIFGRPIKPFSLFKSYLAEFFFPRLKIPRIWRDISSCYFLSVLCFCSSGALLLDRERSTTILLLLLVVVVLHMILKE